MRFIALFILLLSFYTHANNEQTELQRFAGLMPLVGSCWQAPFPDGKKIDTHCFSSVYNGAFIKDQHVVCGEGSPYYGETWYTKDPANGVVSYRYYNSLGGVSDGSVVVKGNQLIFPDETYENQGQKITYRTTWELSSDQYVAKMWQQDEASEGGWKPIWNMLFKQVELGQQDLVQYNNNQELHCH